MLTKYIANVPMIINNITMTLPQTYLDPSISLYPFILGLNFVHSLQGGITIQNNQVSFQPKRDTPKPGGPVDISSTYGIPCEHWVTRCHITASHFLGL